MLKASTQSIVRKTAIAIATSTVLAGAAMTQAGVDFEVSSGKVIPSEDFAVKVSVLGAAITGNDVPYPVTLDIQIDGASYQPFGPLNDPQTGNVNNNMPARHFILKETFDPSTPIVVTGVAWRPFSDRVYKERSTKELTPYIHVLRNGDPVPDVQGYKNQADAAQFVRNYIDTETQTIVLDENQVIYLFELGTDSLNSDAADFQDLVVLVTLGKSPEELENAELMEAMYD